MIFIGTDMKTFKFSKGEFFMKVSEFMHSLFKVTVYSVTLLGYILVGVFLDRVYLEYKHEKVVPCKDYRNIFCVERLEVKP